LGDVTPPVASRIDVAETVAHTYPVDVEGVARAPQRLGLEDVLSVALLAFMVVVTLLVVLGRFAPAMDVPYADQMLPDALVWLAMLGTASAIRWRGHLGMTAAVDLLPRRLRDGLAVAVYLIAATFFATLAVRGVDLVRLQLAQGLNSPAGYPSWVIALAIPVGGGLAFIRIVQAAWTTFVGQVRTRREEA